MSGPYRVCINRLQKEYLEIQRKPEKHILARPSPTNLLEWHYIIFGPEGSQYEGGVYHGQLIFPPEYPHKVSILMSTPSARFECNTRICVTMSDFHPESWNPFWNVSTILLGLLSFMTEDVQGSVGSITAPKSVRMKYAAQSKSFNCQNQTFKKVFPDLYQEFKKEMKEKRQASSSSSSTSSPQKQTIQKQQQDQPQTLQQQLQQPKQNIILIISLFIVTLCIIGVFIVKR
ncbi:hypothetical protein PPL_04281 [Heterostelium album PN500]|uniref:UBC core domain-containing protein n=1 Tax=Heterostelium pallidum (strain ATCC 26659 / Pp 5 / PN500) TaxID=670386 RepID=D3B747_HETP5|nr:hypothetical protein PPL_04281 [Heterostelium album PN500]EFA82590.1 hypothetical protein PPL_04281 [Heterostelium album PN500]|eukprot:XP_020434707.1 hypothetical protein PPL_04281 [Heterostelium album PN500]